MGPTPVVAADAARALVGAKPTDDAFAEAGRRAAAPLSPDGDLHASSEYRKHVAGVLTRRALTRAVSRATR